MGKLYFKYGCVGSAKSMNLLSIAHTYESQKKRVIVLKPSIDTRYGKNIVKSRCGFFKEALNIDTPEQLFDINTKDVDCILYDECQFASEELIDALRELTINKNIPVICFGLKTDFKTKLFTGSKRLLEIADDISEIKSTCVECGKKSIVNKKHSNGMTIKDGPQVEIGGDDKYLQVCWKHYK